MSKPDCIIRFENSFESEKREKRKIKKLSRSDAVRRWNERYMVNDRRKNGFRLETWKEIGGRWRMPFTEKGLRTEDNPILQKFISRVPAAGKLRTGPNKADLSSQYYSKLLSFDEPYIEANKTVIGMIRIDIEATYKSAEHCLAYLEHMVEEGQIPHVPHIIVGDTLRDGSFASPHFIILLPDDAKVWWNFEDVRCRKKPVLLLDSVIRGWYNAFIGHGVDVFAPRHTQRMKNPLSPYWTTLTPKTETFMTLSEYAEYLDIKPSFEELKRRSDAAQNETDIKASNPRWNELKERAKNFTRDMFLNDRKELDRLIINRERLRMVIFNDLKSYAIRQGLNITRDRRGRQKALKPASLDRTCNNIAKYYSDWFDPAKLERNVNKHKLLHLVDGVQGLKERQRIASTYTNDEKKMKFEAAMKAFAKAYDAAISSGEKFTVEALAKSSGISKAAAYKYNKELKSSATAQEPAPVEARKNERPAQPVQAYYAPSDVVEIDDDYSEPIQPSVYDEYDVERAEEIYVSSSLQPNDTCNMLADRSESIY